jgi:hypothetical protein
VSLSLLTLTLPHTLGWTGRSLVPTHSCRSARRIPYRIVAVSGGGGDDDERPQWTQKQLFREEIENPFRKPRQTIAGFSAVSASVAGFISGTRALSCVLGGACLQPMNELVPNLAINAGIVVLSAVSLWNDQKTQKQKLRRIARGGELASLQLAAVGPVARNLAMGSLRNDKRVVIVAGGEEVFRRTVESASAHARELEEGEMVVVPILLARLDGADEGLVDSSGCASGVVAAAAFEGVEALDSFLVARGAEAWGRWIAPEIATANKQGFDVLTSGIAISIKRSGKVGLRQTNVPSWPALKETLQARDKNFGMPQF